MSTIVITIYTQNYFWSVIRSTFAALRRENEGLDPGRRGKGGSRVGQGRVARSTSPRAGSDSCRSARPTRLGLPWSPSSPSPTTSRVVAVPTGEAVEGKV